MILPQHSDREERSSGVVLRPEGSNGIQDRDFLDSRGHKMVFHKWADKLDDKERGSSPRDVTFQRSGEPQLQM